MSTGVARHGPATGASVGRTYYDFRVDGAYGTGNYSVTV